MSYRVVGRVFNVLDNRNAYEYEVSLFDGETEIDSWNSLFECYSIQTGHLSHEAACQAVQEITEDVHEGNTEDWFDIE